MNKVKRIRVLVAKPGLDGHDKGAKIVALSLRDAGMEVIYSGIKQSVDQILNTAIEESVDVIGLSILSGSHVPICEELLLKMGKMGIDDIKVIVGGFIPASDLQILKDLGISGVCRTGSALDEITKLIKDTVNS